MSEDMESLLRGHRRYFAEGRTRDVRFRAEALLKRLIGEVFPPGYVSFLEGGPEVVEEVLKQRFDSIFFTGGSAFGQTVMRAAAEHLTPLTLELGGKSPCIVGRDADIPLAARRIVV